MSRETMTALNNNTLIGYTDKRGHAWHYRASEQGAESNHYAGAVPVEDVRRRLFGWQAASRRVAVEIPADMDTMTHMSDDGEPMRWAVQDDRQAMCPDDTHDVLGLFKSGYQAHQFDAWLLEGPAALLDLSMDGLGISSAGLLKNRAVAWVEIGVPDNITTPEGVTFRPNLLAGSSLDGTVATFYKRTATMTVCDNTFDIARGEAGQVWKAKHTSKSLGKIADAREALNIVYTAADDFAAEVAELCRTDVTDVQFKQVIADMFPIAEGETSKRTITNAENKRGELNQLYKFDERVSPWAGTAFGVVQAFNTWRHHVQNGLSGDTATEKNAARGERNALRAVHGDNGSEDAAVLAALGKVLESV